MQTATDFQLRRDPYGKLVLTLADGSVHAGVVPVRAFPITSPDAGIAVVSTDGRELLWLERLEDAAQEMASLLREELQSREFMPHIRAIRQVSSFATPSTWEVETDRGTTSFILKSEDDIRRLSGGALLISDNNGIQYLIRDRSSLDNASLRILGRFM